MPPQRIWQLGHDRNRVCIAGLEIGEGTAAYDRAPTFQGCLGRGTYVLGKS